MYKSHVLCTSALHLTCVWCCVTVPILVFATMFGHRHAIQKLGVEMRQYNQPRHTGLTANQLIKSKQARSSFASLTTEIRWLLPKFEKFLPEYWYHGVVLLALRLLQTSFMALVPSQLAQAAIMLCVTQVAILLQCEFSPYRRASDNHVALLAQVLVFAWVLVLMLRIAGVFVRPVAAMVIGVLLCVATVAVFVLALVLANTDRRNEKRAGRSDSNEEVVELTTGQPADGTGEKDPGEIEAGPSQGRESPIDNEEKFEQRPDELPWSSILSIGTGALCGAETADDDAVSGSSGEASADDSSVRRIEKLIKELASKECKSIKELKTMISRMDDSS